MVEQLGLSQDEVDEADIDYSYHECISFTSLKTKNFNLVHKLILGVFEDDPELIRFKTELDEKFRADPRFDKAVL